MILLMSMLTMLSAKEIQEKTRHNFLHVWAQKAKRKFSPKGSVSEIKSDLDLQLHHLSGTVEFIIKQAAKNPANQNTLNKIERKIKAVLEEGYRLQHQNHDKEKLMKFLTEVKQVRTKFKNIEQQRKNGSKRNSYRESGFGVWNMMALSSVLSILGSLIR